MSTITEFNKRQQQKNLEKIAFAFMNKILKPKKLILHFYLEEQEDQVNFTLQTQ